MRGERVAQPDELIAAVARGQHGLATAEQLVAILGDRSALARRVRSGSLHRLHRGVYAVGHVAPSRERTYLAAVLACGESTALSHFAAADLLDLWPNTRRPVDVVVPDRGRRARRSGIRVHRSRTIDATQVIAHRGIPVTSVLRTLADLRRLLPRPAWLRAAHEAQVRHRVHVPTAEPVTLSRPERRLLRICRRHGLPLPQTNVLVEGLRREHRVDAWWPEAQLVVEIDSYAFHSSQQAFEADRERSADLEDAGRRVLRIAIAQLDDEEGVARRLARRLR